jgi:hypothetical protein
MEVDAVGSGLFPVAVFLTNQLQIMKFLGMHSFLVYSYFLFSAEGSDIFSAPCSRTLQAYNCPLRTVIGIALQ